MSSLHRDLAGDVLVHHLRKDEQTIDAALLARSGRSARTLVKQGPLRVTLLALAAGGELPAHHADGPVTIQVVEGDVTFEAVKTAYALSPGDLLVLAAGVEHSARSTAGVVFLLTLVQDPR